MLTAWEQSVSKPVWHIPLLCVQRKTRDDGQRNCPKHVEFYSENKFEKLVHLVVFIIRIYHDSRSPESKITELCLLYYICSVEISLCDFPNSQWKPWFVQGALNLVKHLRIKCNVCYSFVYSQYYLLGSKANFLVLFVSKVTSLDEFPSALLFLSFASTRSAGFVIQCQGWRKDGKIKLTWEKL